MSSRKSGAAATSSPLGKGYPAQYGRYQLIDVQLIDVVTGHNARRQVGVLDQLITSIQECGILQPLTVAEIPSSDRFELIAGERRLAAARQIGLGAVPAIVRNYHAGDVGLQERTIAMLVENLQRADLDPLEEASGFKTLVDRGLSQREVADKVGRSQAHVSKRLALLLLPDEAKQAVISGGISNEDALELVKLVDHPARVVDALKVKDSHGSLNRRVQEHLAELAARDAQQATRAHLDGEGIKVLGHAESRWDNAYRLGKQHMADCPADAPTTDEILAAKKKLGAFINWDGSVTYVSTEPVKNSVRKETAEQKAWREERDRKDRERAEKRAQVAARREALKSLLAGKLAAVHRDHVLRMAPYMSDTEREEYQVAELLGIELPDDQHDIAELQAIFDEWVDGSIDRALRYAYACALVDGEENAWMFPVAQRIHEEHLAVIGLAGPAEEGAGEPAQPENMSPESPASSSVADGIRRAQAELDAEGPLRNAPEVQRGEIDGAMTTITRIVPEPDPEVGDFGDPVVPLDQDEPEPCSLCVKLVNGKCRSCGREVVLTYVDGKPVSKAVARSVA